MQPKNLGWKFAFVGLLVLMCIYSIWAKELRQGIDLRGGHVLTFQIETTQTQRADLQRQISAVEQQLKATTQPDKVEQINNRLAELRGRLAELAGPEESDLVQRVIARLKDRIDPNGLYSLEWRPVGPNRFEVRMPLGTEESLRAKQKYMDALEAVRSGNVQLSELRRLVTLPGEGRAAEIDRISRGDPARKAALEQLIQAHDAMVSAREAREKLSAATTVSAQALQDAQAAYFNALAGYESAVRDVLAGNINTEQLGQIVELYVSDRERSGIPKSEADDRMAAFKEQLALLREQHLARAGEIDAASSAFTTWADKRVGLDDPADLKRMVARAGVLEFRIAPTLPGSGREPRLTEPDYEYYTTQLAEQGPLVSRSRAEPYQWFEIRGKGERFPTDMLIGKYAGKRYALLSNQPGMTMLHTQRQPWSLRASPTNDDLGRPAVGFRLDGRGAKLMGTLTSNNKGKILSILLDDQVYSAPTIEEAIFANGIIRGDFTTRQVGELVRILEAGALEGRVNENPVSEKTIAPSIGEDNRRAGIRAAIWGLVGVATFMAIYYLMPGVIATLAMLLNLLLLLGTMSFIEAVFTLPGIAGVILSMGMAVDANVLIYERLREEQAKTQSMRMAIRNAYHNAFSAILDGNVTTLITCVILGWVGTEEVRGFAIALGLGVVFNLFTGVLVTRWVFQLLVELGLIKDRVHMLAFIGVPRINWMSKRAYFWAISGLAMAAGIASLAAQGKEVLGIEFSSGTQATFAFKRGAEIPAGGRMELPSRPVVQSAIRQKAQELASEASAQPGALPEGQPLQGKADALTKIARTAKVETVLNLNEAAEWMKAYDTNGDGAIEPSEWAAAQLGTSLFAALDLNTDGKLQPTELSKGLPERTYQVSTTVADLELLRQVVRETFGAALDMRGSVDFVLRDSGRVPGVNVELNPADKGITHISAQLEQQAAPELRAKFTDYIGGVIFLIDQVNPSLTEAELADRIQTIRWQPDFESFQYNETSVIGLRANPAGKGFVTLAVLSRNPNADFVGRPEEWKVFAEQEKTILTEALKREEALESLEFDPAIAGETGQLAVIAFVLSWAAIIVYLWLRFGSARWGLAAVICLIHDTLIAVGLVAASAYVGETVFGRALLIWPFRIDMALVAAFLTIIGYSVNDTIVVFDRIRENRGRLATVDEATINRSINQTMSRTLLTGSTTLIAVVVMYLFGGAGIHAFTFALLVGIIFGTYSSIAIASPLLLGFKHAMVGAVVRAPAPAAK